MSSHTLSSVAPAGPKPSELYGKYTWKIENFSEVNKRELRSAIFEVGSYKWCAAALRNWQQALSFLL